MGVAIFLLMMVLYFIHFICKLIAGIAYYIGGIMILIGMLEFVVNLFGHHALGMAILTIIIGYALPHIVFILPMTLESIIKKIEDYFEVA